PCFSRFFCYASLLPSCLRSFPTRRSSDLVKAIWATSPKKLGGCRWKAARRRRSGRTIFPTCLGSSNGDDWSSHSDCRKNRPSRPDRKSTRLNSSHQIISYAVFCLKKKKTL